MIRPPDRQSSIAISSATRLGGLYSASELPHSAIAEFLVVAARMAAIRLGEGVIASDVWWCSLSSSESQPRVSACCIRRRYMWYSSPTRRGSAYEAGGVTQELCTLSPESSGRWVW